MTTQRILTKKLLLTISLVIFCRPALWAQQTPAGTETRIGCLIDGGQSGTFVLVEDVSGQRTTVAGLPLNPFKTDQRVTLTGTLNAGVFQVTRVEAANMACYLPYSSAELSRSIGNARLGVRAGVGLDPELPILGVQAEFGPLFRNFWVRPTAEYAFGEVTKAASFNPELTYYMPFLGQGANQNRYNAYVGAGPALVLISRDFEGFPNQPEVDVDSDWDFDLGLNLFFGVAKPTGMFFELKAAAYSTPDVRIFIGYNF